MTLSAHCQQLVTEERQRFEQDYQAHYLAGESKPPSIGAPYLLHHPGSDYGVLLVHGLMAAPEEVREWADFLYAQGYTVYAPRMLGHGTSAVDLSQRTATDWIASVERGQAILQACCRHLVVAGFSTGGAVALNQVIRHPTTFDGLVSISAPLRFKKHSAHLARPLRVWNQALQRLDISWGKKEFVTNHADNPHINYLRCPISGIAEIQGLMREVQKGLPSIRIPTLVMHGRDDPKVDVSSGRLIFKSLTGPRKRYREVDYHLHGIIRGAIGQTVFTEVLTFLQDLWPESGICHAGQP